MVFLLRYFVLLGFTLPIDAFCDCIPAHTSIQALGLLYRMAETEVFCDLGLVKVFCRMVQSSVNIRRLDMSRMTDTDDVKSLTNAIIMDAANAFETIPNLDAKFSFLPYKFYKDGPSPDKARLFYCTPFVHDGIMHKDVSVPFYSGKMTQEDIKVFMSLFKIKGHAEGAMRAIQLFLQKYSNMKGRKGWDDLGGMLTLLVTLMIFPCVIFSTS
jgi:ubiquitin